MSAELYDAEMAGALARPAIDVLPTSSKKDKSAEVAPAAPLAAPAPEQDLAPPVTDHVTAPGAPAEAEAAPVAAPTIEAVAEEAAVRKVFGMPLSRGRRAKSEAAPPAPVEAAAVDMPEAEVPEVEVPGLEPEDVPVALATDAVPAAGVTDDEGPSATPVEAAAEVAEPVVVQVAPVVPDHSEEIRALQALLEASERVRQEAEARTAAAEASARTTANAVQEWQIRHREAESTITELAASLTGAESRMAELHQQVAALQAERDDLTSQLDAATSPTA